MGRHSVLQAHPLVVILIVLACVSNDGMSWLPTVNAFSSSRNRHDRMRSNFHQSRRATPQSLLPPPSKLLPFQRRDTTALAMGDDWWNSLKGIFDGLTNALNNNFDGQSEDDEMAAGTSIIASIPVQTLKPGGLRLFLMFFLLGMQNTPDKGSWKAHQPDSPPSPITQYSSSTPTTSSETDDDESDNDQPADDEFDSTYVLEMFYKDASAMISIELFPNEVQIQRCGSLPSTSYLMQETVLLEAILDELETCAFDDSVDEEHRLLLLSSPDAIANARSTLAFA